MQSKDLVDGKNYAYRSTPRASETALELVKFLGVVRSGQAKVRHAKGDLAGLEEWVSTRTLLCLWSEHDAFVRDERRELAIKAHFDEHADDVLAGAVSLTLESTGECGGVIRDWHDTLQRVERVWQRAKMPGRPTDHPLSYTDRHGRLHVPFEVALECAQRFAREEPETVVLEVREYETPLQTESWAGDDFSKDWLRKHRPIYALMRQWAGTAEVDKLVAENERLRGLLSRALLELHRAGSVNVANNLERKVKSGE